MDLYYINLKRRTDRREEFLKECKRIGYPAWNIYRFEAIEEPHPMGYLGCTKSHLAVLKLAKENKLPCVFIAEDDLNFSIHLSTYQEIWKIAFEYLENNFDVLMVSSNTIRANKSSCKMADKAIEAQTASGYIVHAKFYDKLIACLEQAVKDIVKYRSQNFTIDQAWKKLQPVSLWYICHPKLGYQRPSYSDLALRHVNYGC